MLVAFDIVSNVNNKSEINFKVRKEVGLEINVPTWQVSKIRTKIVQQLWVKNNFKGNVSGRKVRSVYARRV